MTVIKNFITWSFAAPKLPSSPVSTRDDSWQLIDAFSLYFLCPFAIFVAIGCRLAIEPKADTECNRVGVSRCAPAKEVMTCPMKS